MLSDIYNFLQLEENLATSGQPSEAQLAEIAAAGYEVVINLGLAGAEYALPDEAASVRALGMEYVHLPVVWTAPTPRDLERFCALMESYQGRKLYVHCAANMRVSSFIALYRIRSLGWNRPAALADVHRIWQPDERWQDFIDSNAGGGRAS